jgi:hypothetical protein
MHPAEAVESCADNRRLVFAMTVSRHPQAAAPRLLPRLWLLVAGVLAVGALARLGLWLDYAGAQRPGGLPPMLLWWGVRYDLAAGATLALLVGVACLLPWVLGRRAAAARWAEWLAVALLSALVLLAGCEHYYYAFYKTRFDPIVFGLFEDDTAAVLKTVWHDYPLVRGALAWAVCVVLLALGLPRLAARLDAHWPRSRSRALALVLAALQFVLLLAASAPFRSCAAMSRCRPIRSSTRWRRTRSSRCTAPRACVPNRWTSAATCWRACIGWAFAIWPTRRGRRAWPAPTPRRSNAASTPRCPGPRARSRARRTSCWPCSSR